MPQGGTVTPLEALKALMELIGDSDLPDNGELNGAAICDMARAAINSAENTIAEAIKITGTAKGFECEASGLVSKLAFCVRPEDVRHWLRHIEGLIILNLDGTATASTNSNAKPPIVLNISDPVPDLDCSTCGEKHKYDRAMGWGCLILLDDREIPHTVLGAWCSEACLVDWLETQEAKALLAPGM